ncbi:MAG TPA: hypothetical protein VIL72_15245 [Beijerinckiaceae bacterium]|jgi:hypothetical protein
MTDLDRTPQEGLSDRRSGKLLSYWRAALSRPPRAHPEVLDADQMRLRRWLMMLLMAQWSLKTEEHRDTSVRRAFKRLTQLAAPFRGRMHLPRSASNQERMTHDVAATASNAPAHDAPRRRDAG